MNQTIKNFWANRRQNAWIVVEIALVAILSFYFLDYFVVSFYDTHLCRPAGDFERDHLVVGQVGMSPEAASDSIGEASLANLYALRDKVRALPEVQYAGLASDFVGEGYSSRLSTFRAEADTTRWCGANSKCFLLGEQFFETQGLTPVEGSPSAEKLSNECPADGAIITRSMALALFGTDQAVGRRIVETDYDGDAVQHGPTNKIVARYTVFGVVEDFRLKPRERYAYAVLTRVTALSTNTPRMLIRLRPGEDADEFVIRQNSAERQLDLMTGEYGLAVVRTYTEYQEQLSANESDNMVFYVMGTFVALLLLNVILGTLGTFWLQIRKRTEDIGIMRSFGAKRSNVFWMLWREAALLTFVASVFGWVIWLQFAINIGLATGFTMTGTGQETDWVNTFWLHYLIICAIQYVLLLAIVTLGIVVPTFRAMYKRPVEALRHE